MTSSAPLIAATNSTPPRANEPNSSAYRLLYRGALSLPDSHLLLDGLTFVAKLETPSKNNHLLENPLALALESMRGRPSLRFIGVVQLNDDNLWLDESGGIELDIHPRATLSRIYFENIFCLKSFASTSKTTLSTGISDVGVKVALGDTDGPDTTQVLIFARTSEHAADNADMQTLDLVVARVAPRPPPPPLEPPPPRLPRPDDPTPREPPLILFGAGKREPKRLPSIGLNAPAKELKRAASSSNLGANPKRKKLVNGEKNEALFKVPEVPVVLSKSNAKGKRKQTDKDEDVFGDVDIVRTALTSAGKLKVDEAGMAPGDEVVEMERANKNVIKRSTLDYLYKTKDPTTGKANKSQPEFKDLFGWIYRGVGYALRAQMKVRPVDQKRVDRLVQMHVDMYVGGNGGITAYMP